MTKPKTTENSLNKKLATSTEETLPEVKAPALTPLEASLPILVSELLSRPQGRVVVDRLAVFLDLEPSQLQKGLLVPRSATTSSE